MRLIVFSLLALMVIGCTTDETLAEKQEVAKDNAAMNAESSGLTESGAVDDSISGVNPLDPPPPDFTIKL